MSLVSKEKKRPVGRPPKNKEDIRVQQGLKMSPREKAIALKNAKKAGMGFSEYVRSRIL